MHNSAEPVNRPFHHSRGAAAWRGLQPIAIAVAAIMLIELFVFNLPFWQTLRSAPEVMREDGMGSGLTVVDDGTAFVNDPDYAWRDISVDQPIEYLYIGHSDAENPRQDDSVLWQISTRKDTDSGWYDANANVGYSPSSEDSRYQRVGGKATHVRIRYTLEKGKTIPITPITANPHVPLRFSPMRLALEIIVALFALAFRPGSRLYRIPFRIRRRACWVPLIAATALACAIPLALFVQASPLEEATPLYWADFASLHATDQYQKLAEALLQGRTWLDYPVNEHLAAMANPYDTRGRTAIGLAYPQTPIYFDVAFFHGRYYSYFGVLPALLLFAPYRLITGARLDTNTAIMVCVTMAMLACALLSVQFARLFGRVRGRQVSLAAVLFAVIAGALGTGMPILIQLGLWYQVPQQMAVAFAMLGIAFWIEAKLRRLNKPLLAVGSFCMALTIASRPQVLAAALIAVPLFWDEIVMLWDGGRRSRKAMAEQIRVWACAAVPFILVFVPQFMYNAARFGKPFDFGANYNLTGYDMTHFNAPLTEYFSYVYYYFFRTPNMSAHFPFVDQSLTPLTTWRSEHVQFGGYFMTTDCFALLLFTAPAWRRTLRRIKGARLIVGALVPATLVFIVDGRITGVDYRYQIDFVWMIMIAALTVMFAADLELNRPNDDGLMISAPVSGQSPIKGKPESTSCLDEHDDTLRRIVFGFLMVTLICSFLFTFFKQFMPHMNMPVGTWWDTMSWFVFM